jgi:hypothetical protein
METHSRATHHKGFTKRISFDNNVFTNAFSEYADSRLNGNIALTATPRVIAVRVRDDGGIDHAMRIDVEITCLAIEAFLG